MALASNPCIHILVPPASSRWVNVMVCAAQLQPVSSGKSRVQASIRGLANDDHPTLPVLHH